MANSKYSLSDELWEKIQTFIPVRENSHPRGGGRKPKDDRAIFEAILFVLRFGCRWNALNATGLGCSSTVHDRFLKWSEAGVFHRLHEAGLLERESATRGLDWSWLEAEGDSVHGKRDRRWRERSRTTFASRYRRYSHSG